MAVDIVSIVVIVLVSFSGGFGVGLLTFMHLNKEWERRVEREIKDIKAKQKAIRKYAEGSKRKFVEKTAKKIRETEEELI